MKHKFEGWDSVATRLRASAANYQVVAEQSGESSCRLNIGQRASLIAIADRIAKNGLVIADEVGMGKTRIAVELIRSVVEAGGRTAILVPSGLDFQWRDELKKGGIEVAPVLRSLEGYLNASSAGSSNETQPWFDRKVSLISHTFTNWKIGSSTKAVWWTLLPMILALWRKKTSASKKFPKGFLTNAKGLNFQGEALQDVRKTAEDILAKITLIGRKRLAELSEDSQMNEWGGKSHLFEPEKYSKDKLWRYGLERVVGIGLGEFDLLVIDEAHKNRGADSGLSNLLDKVIMSSPSARRVSMTATPVELDVSQWEQTLSRIGLEKKLLDLIMEDTRRYADAVKRVRQCPNNEEARLGYQQSSKNFQDALSPYLLRRDKREDPAVQLFAERTGLPIHAYRQELEIAVETVSLPLLWRQVVCAAEALSAVTRQAENSKAKRLRLTMGNGHGITALIDETTRDTVRADEQEEEEEGDAVEESVSVSDTKRSERVAWWISAMTKALPKGGAALFHHPAILAAVNAVETVTEKGGKVLVFGRFTEPMRVFVALLNAREMLRCLQSDRSWPQSKVLEATADEARWSDRSAIVAAHEQIQCAVRMDEIDQRLQSQYDKLEQQREKLRNSLIANIELGLRKSEADARCKNSMLFDVFKSRAQAPVVSGDQNALALVSRAISELLGEQLEMATPANFADAFLQLLDALSDRGEGDLDHDGEVDEQEVGKLWLLLEARLYEEYNRPQGGFARLIFGGTAPESRRMMQLAFNRSSSYPKVLVAQSVVGREGLNLHKACRTVVLLHPEWNPGVVEQQIGRVDRVGSHWEMQLNEAIEDGRPINELPRIDVLPVIFRGTYDEYNWKVLRERWDDLRSQLHGIVSPLSVAAADLEQQRLFAEIAKSAPNFSPSRRP